MSDLNVDLSLLPQDIKDKLAELDLELSEGRRSKDYFMHFVYNLMCYLLLFKSLLLFKLCIILFYFNNFKC